MKPVRAGLAALALVLLVPSAFAQKWQFVVAGDGRSDPRHARAEDRDGVNIVITREMAQAAVREDASFLLWTGDLALGDPEGPAFESMLMTWRTAMEPAYNHHIPVLAVRGNHESYCKDSVAIWNKVFSGPYALPQNGPATEKNLSYYYEKGPVLAIGLDEYAAGKEEINQAWLNEVLASHKKPLIFAYGHEPAFMDGAHKDTLDAHPDNRDALWDSLVAAGCRVYFSGHDHLYDHMSITLKGQNPPVVMHQIVAGTAGAPFYAPGEYTGKNTKWEVSRVKNIANTYGYMLVEVDGNTATITFKGRTAPGVYTPMDSFTITGQ